MNQQPLEQIMFHFYNGIIDEKAWDLAVEELRGLFQSDEAQMQIQWPKAGRKLVTALSSTQVSGRALTTNAEESWCSTCGRCKKIWDKKRHEVFLDYDPSGSWMCVPGMESNEMTATLSFRSGPHRKPYGSNESSMLAWLMSRVSHAAAMRGKLRHLFAVADYSQRLLDRMHSPVIVLNESGNFMFCNTSGSLWLTRHGFGPSTSIIPSDRAVPRQLTNLARETCADPENRMPIGRKGLRVTGLENISLICIPLHQEHLLLTDSHQIAAAILIQEPGAPPMHWSHLLQELFGLSRAELRLVEEMIKHDSLYDAATHIGIGRETARTQLKAIFRKTGAHKQSDLIRMSLALSQLH